MCVYILNTILLLRINTCKILKFSKMGNSIWKSNAYIVSEVKLSVWLPNNPEDIKRRIEIENLPSQLIYHKNCKFYSYIWYQNYNNSLIIKKNGSNHYTSIFESHTI
jgi:hypothetical protein